jgi:RNA polymerase sigma factor (sigma-70 family)
MVSCINLASIRINLPDAVSPHSCEPARDSGDGDIGDLYRRFSGALERIVRSNVRSSDFVEDACQFAWTSLMLHRASVHEDTAPGWLVRTAIREALKLSRRCARELSLDDAIECGIDPVSPTPEPWELLMQRDQVAAVSRLAVRRQRIVWLKALGFSYSEIAERERCTPRTVDRHLGRARSALRTAVGATPGGA